MSLRQVCFAPPASGESQAALTEREGLSLAQHDDDEDEKEAVGEEGCAHHCLLLASIGRSSSRFDTGQCVLLLLTSH